MSESSLPLVTRAIEKNRTAIEELLVQHLPGLRGWLRLRMGRKLQLKESPDDLVQSVAREVLGELKAFEWRGEAAFRHWLYLRAQHKLVDKARFVDAECRSPAREREFTESAHAALFGNLLSPSGEAASTEEIQRIERAFEDLPDDYREAICLQRLCGMSYDEIATRMQRTPGAARNLVHRGLSKLALRLGELRRGEQG